MFGAPFWAVVETYTSQIAPSRTNRVSRSREGPDISVPATARLGVESLRR
jgi:hypothetical protein